MGSNVNALPDNSDVTVGPGATLALGGSDTVKTLALNGATLAGTGVLTATSYSLDSGTVNAELGSGTFTSIGASSVSKPVAAQTVTVDGGTLTLTGSNLLNDAAVVSVNGSATRLTLGGADTIQSLTLNGSTLDASSGSTGVLTAATYALIDGHVLAGLGTGTLTSSGESSLSAGSAAATVQVDSGRLTLANGDLSDSAAVTVLHGATLGDGQQRHHRQPAAARHADLGTSTAGTLTAGTYTLDGGIVQANLGSGALSSSGSSRLESTAAVSSVNVTGGVLTLSSADRFTALPDTTVAGTAALVLGGNIRWARWPAPAASTWPPSRSPPAPGSTAAMTARSAAAASWSRPAAASSRWAAATPMAAARRCWPARWPWRCPMRCPTPRRSPSNTLPRSA